MEVKVIGIDLGKNLCSLVALDDVGRVIFRRRMRPGSLVAFVQKLSPCVIGPPATADGELGA
jgi:transposase